MEEMIVVEVARIGSMMLLPVSSDGSDRSIAPGWSTRPRDPGSARMKGTAFTRS
jgi:hypothetical protein